MKELENVLKNGTLEEIKKYLDDAQTEYYIGDDEVVYYDFLYQIEDYDKLISVLGIDEATGLVKNKFIDRINFLDIISIFKTDIYDLYFTRIEQYGYADEDAVVYRIAFTKDVERLFEDSKKFAENNDFIKGRNEQLGSKAGENNSKSKKYH